MTDVLKLEEFLPYRLVALAAHVSRKLARRYEEEFDLTIPEWRVMATLGQFGTRTAKAIAEHSNLDNIKVSRAVARLDRKGFITRVPNDADRRETHLRLNADGIRVYRRIVPEALAYERALVEDLSPEERREMSRLIHLLTDRVGEL
jgi:DNA-binding MarR family transcriptional regulator